jgi:hypothetical protein
MPPPPPPLYAAFDAAKTLSQPQKTKALVFSLQSCETRQAEVARAPRNVGKKRFVLETSATKLQTTDRGDGEVQSEVRANATTERRRRRELATGSTDAETPTKPQWMKP